jgi:hypothetical protein
MKINLMTVALGVAFLFSSGLLAKVGWMNFELRAANEKLNKELMESDLELGRAETKFGNANKYIKQLEADIRKEIKDREAIATRYGTLQARYRKLVKNRKAKKVNTEYANGKKLKIPGKLAKGQLYEATDKVQ